MSGVDRRTVLGGAAALIAAPAITRAQEVERRWEGTRENIVHSFKGIRYGTAQRFLAPQPFLPAEPVYATQFGPSCPQPGTRYLPTGEDCLYLNIWTVEPDPRVKKPVMVYFHGGGYATGSVTDPLTDGSYLASRGDVVVVTVNHRLNAFGYLYLARLADKFPDSGNLGQLDLILALQWVRDHIAGFGGDPDKVMVFGQSGGGAKIATLMGMPGARGLFHRAATMSGQQVTVSGPLHATQRARAFLAKLKVKEGDLSPLLALPPEKLVEGLAANDPFMPGGVHMGPVLDMKSLDRHPFWPDAHPLGNKIPLMLGNTRQETGAFIDPDGTKLKDLNWNNLAARLADELRVDILPEWVVDQYQRAFPNWTPARILYDASTAARSWRGQIIEAEARADADAAAWVYQLDFTSRADPRRGAFQSLDIPLVFGTLDAQGSQTGTGGDALAVARAMQESFVAFATNGDPANPSVPKWPKYERKTRATMIFDTLSRVENDPRRWQRELFARVPYTQSGS